MFEGSCYPQPFQFRGFEDMSGATLDSKAVFQGRAREFGCNPDELRVLAANNWDTFASFAFSVNYVPGQQADGDFRRMCALVCEIDPAPIDRVPILRRLFFEAFTMAASDMKSRFDGSQSDTPKRLAAPERAVRYNEQAARLAGLSLTGELDISHQLLDVVMGMHDTDVLTYLDLSACTKRGQELLGIKVNEVLRTCHDGTLKLGVKEAELTAHIATDLHLKYALQRRALAFDQARLFTFARLEEWSEVLLAAYLREAIPDYSKINLSQIIRADQELFRRIQECTRSGIRMLPNGSLPCDAALATAKLDVSVLFLLLPLARAKSSSPALPDKSISAAARAPTLPDPNSKRQKKLAAKAAASASSKPAKGAGKGKQSTKTAGSTLPPGLAGMAVKDNQGNRLCYAFNLAGCSSPGIANGSSCSRGRHVCCMPGCFSDQHALPGH
jgi:hypothetical protein